MSEFFKVLAENGIGVGLAGIIAFMFYKVLMHTLKQQENILNMATEQNEKWQKTIDEHTAQAKIFHEQSNDAHKYQREEHLKMMEYLGKLCAKI